MINYFAISCLLIFVTNIPLGIFIYLKNRRQPANLLFLILTLVTSLWALGIALEVTANTKAAGLFWGRLLHFGVVFIPVIYAHFVLTLLRLEKKERKVIIASYITGIVFSISNFTNLLVKDVRPIKELNFNFFIDPGILYGPFLLMFFSLPSYAFIKALKEYPNTKGLKRNQIRYIILASLFAFIGGSSTYFPAYNIYIYPYANFLVVFYPFILAYAIIRYNLMDIRLIITLAGLFIFIYSFVLGLPFYIGYITRSWLLVAVSMFIFATMGPIIYTRLRRRAEDILLREEKSYQQNTEIMAEKIAFMRNTNQIADLITTECYKIINLTYTALYVYDEIDHEYKVVKSQGNFSNLPKGAIPNDDNLIKAFETRRQILIADELEYNASLNGNISDIAKIIKTMQEINASLIAPCFIKKGLIGFLVFGDKESKRHFTEDDLTTFSILANKTAIGIENDLHDKKMYDQTQKEAVTDLAFNAAHQFQNNLAKTDSTAGSMSFALKKLNLDAISLDDAKSKIKACIAKFDQITEITQDGAKIISSILDKQKAKEEFKSVNLHNIVQTAVKNSSAEKQKSILEQEGMITPVMLNQIPKDVKEIPANESLLQNAFLNLINNACDACIEKHRYIKGGSLPEYKGELPYKPKIIISSKEFENTVLIKVEDNGMGMKEDAFRRLFVPFATTKGPSKGHGIGLNVVREIVEKDHNGKVSAQTQYGEGTTFTIELPKKMKGL